MQTCLDVFLQMEKDGGASPLLGVLDVYIYLSPPIPRMVVCLLNNILNMNADEFQVHRV